VRELDEAEFKATIVAPMQRLDDIDDPIDIWPYVDPIATRFHVHPDGLVDVVYRTADGRFDHVCVKTTMKDVYLVVIVDIERRIVHGHHLLDLPGLYGDM